MVAELRIPKFCVEKCSRHVWLKLGRSSMRSPADAIQHQCAGYSDSTVVQLPSSLFTAELRYIMRPVEPRLLLSSSSRHNLHRQTAVMLCSVFCWVMQDIQQEIFRITGAPAYRQRLLCESEVLDPRRRLQASVRASALVPC